MVDSRRVDPISTFRQAHETASAQFDKIVEQARHLQVAQGALLDVMKLGALMEPEDVIKASSRMVSEGLDPHMVASHLAQMPQTGGEPLQGWVAGYMTQISQAMSQMAGLREAARHALGLHAMGVLAGEHFANMQPGGGPSQTPTRLSPGQNQFQIPDDYIEPPGRPTQPPANDLMPSSGPSNAA